MEVSIKEGDLGGAGGGHLLLNITTVRPSPYHSLLLLFLNGRKDEKTLVIQHYEFKLITRIF